MGYIWVTKNSALTHKCCIIVLSCSHLKPVENLSIGLKQPNQEPRPSNQSLKALGSRFPIQQLQQTGHHESKLLGLFTLRTGRMLPPCLRVTAANGCGSAARGIRANPVFGPRGSAHVLQEMASKIHSGVVSFGFCGWIISRGARLQQHP